MSEKRIENAHREMERSRHTGEGRGEEIYTTPKRDGGFFFLLYFSLSLAVLLYITYHIYTSFLIILLVSQVGPLFSS